MRPFFFLLALCAAMGAAGQSTKEVRRIAKEGTSAIPELQHFLLNPDVKVRMEAVRGLVDIGGARTLDPLIAATRDSDANVQIAAVNGLVAFYVPGYVKTGLTAPLKRFGTDLRSRFGDNDSGTIEPYVIVRPEVIKAVGRLAQGGSTLDSRTNAARAVGVLRGKQAIPELTSALKMRDTDLIFESLVALEKIADPSACDGIRFLIGDFDEKVQIEAIDANGTLVCRAALPDIIDVLKHTSKDKVRRSALTSIAMIPDPANRPLFESYLQNDDDRLRTAAAEGFARLASIQDARMLQRRFDAETHNATRLALAFALVMDGNLATTEFAPLTLLMNSLDVVAYRNAAYSYLTEAGRNEEVRKAFYPRVEHGTRDEKIYLGMVLAVSGDASSIPFVEKLTLDPDPLVAKESLRSLRNLRARL